MGNCCSVSLSIDNLITPCCALVNDACSNFEDSLPDLRNKLDELTGLKNDTRRQIDVVEIPGMQRRDQVQRWLSRVDVMENEVNGLIDTVDQEIQRRWCSACCPRNCWSTYKLRKRVVIKLKEMDDLKTEKETFDGLVDRLPPTKVDERPSEATVGTELMLNRVWNTLMEENTTIMGLYGLGGVGKTTLLTQINNKFLNTSHDFDVVIWVVVSKDANMENVQNRIRERIRVSDELFKGKSIEEKAIVILNELSKKKFVLLLDDIWKRFDLLKIGVPLLTKENRSKVVFTTRSVDVCGRMEAQKKIKVECLPWTDAWDLFQKKVGEETLNSDPRISELAQLVAKECGGLPLALITIGRAMACKKTSQEWEYAIEVLKKFAAEFSGMGDEVFPLLHFSYESLPSDTVKSCFLYCCLFPEDSNIHKEDLIDYLIGEGILNKSYGARNQGYDIIGTLLHACLLEEVSREDVKMHDVLRDMALWIGCEYGKAPNKFLVQAGTELTRAPEVSKGKGVKRMSLMRNGVHELTGSPTCPELTTLLLNYNSLKTISSGFFRSMHVLKVLDMSHNDCITEFPLEICELISLRYLNLSWTRIRKLPVEFKNLVNLTYLNLGSKKELDIPIMVMSSLSLLQVFEMLYCGSSAEVVGHDVLAGDREALLEELDCLKHLNDFRITIENTSVFHKLSSFPNVPSSITKLQFSFERRSGFLDISPSLYYMKHLRVLHFYFCEFLEDLVIDWTLQGNKIQMYDPLSSVDRGYQCFHNLHLVTITGCHMLKNIAWLIFSPSITTLEIKHCSQMEEVLCGGKWIEVIENAIIPKPFAKLERLTVHFVGKMKSIYPNALPFPCLRFITVTACPELNKLPLNSNSAKGCGIVIEGHRAWFNKLEWEDEATKHAFLPRFRELLYP